MPRSAKALLTGAAACGAGFVVLLVLAYFWGFGRWLDAAALYGFIDLRAALPNGALRAVASLADPAPYVILGATIAAWAFAQGRPRHGAAVVLLLAISAVASQALQVLLAHPRPHDLIGAEEIAAAAFPSGHSAAAMSLALSAVLVAPPAWRATAAALGSLFALSVAGSVIVLGWHFPSDALGGFALATGIALGLCAALRTANERWPERTGRRAVAAAARGPYAVAAFAALALTAFTLPRLPQAAGYAEHHTTSVAATLGLAVAACTALAAVAAGERG